MELDAFFTILNSCLSFFYSLLFLKLKSMVKFILYMIKFDEF